ncbi:MULTISPECIES: GspH/FimT family pseudopilin [Stutzerimonas]|jgi:type IV fimbrial biogenesis protein FimT|uniref:Type II secretion system protein H n=2 Tax=Stutzerimonas TaxID=2901164 RepID=M2UL92_STUST|nr:MULTISPECIES: GspH/FimT family pseudopilin [Stutzerimonas]HBC00995.1 prepilin-type N-terminal cleavage/methylation domain-containing protein [Pseudomonas sp.]EMD99299.1 Tfp pilus assembly protein FimT-like protein [Stutzerimonas stutzeri NF13]MBK3881897.1 prepilin-type N-terminal cleavage/methylation domain-containing protein [Stutzerimonas stutzeri]MCW8154890.1 prepilin-type N-terminal cleavage/methylation domain-containing protein [Stutzerimonas stutzeri]RRV06599.1 prepilin-type N-termina
MANRNQGFTLIDLMVTLSVLSVVAAIAIPAFGNMIERSRQEALKDEVESTLHNARTQAVLRRRTIEICGSGDGATCSTNWADGWLVRTTTGQTLQLTQLPHQAELSWIGFSESIRFRDNGAAPASNGRFYQCHGKQVAWQVVVSRQGRIRQASEAENTAQASLCR